MIIVRGESMLILLKNGHNLSHFSACSGRGIGPVVNVKNLG